MIALKGLRNFFLDTLYTLTFSVYIGGYLGPKPDRKRNFAFRPCPYSMPIPKIIRGLLPIWFCSAPAGIHIISDICEIKFSFGGFSPDD